MAEKFYEIGRAGRERKVDYSKVFDSTIKAVETKLADSKLKTEELISKMPQGVPIDKVPEELRGQVTAFLTQGKQKYVDASKIIASGIPASSQKYLDAVETMNTVNNSFSKLSDSLESIAVQRQKDLDNTGVSDGAFDWQGIDQNNLANGSMYASMSLQADGNWTYGSAELDDSGNAKTKLWDDYSSAPKPGTDGVTSFIAMRDTVRRQKREGQSWDSIKEDYSQAWDGLMTKLETNGVRDMIFQDKEYMKSKITVDQTTDPDGYKKQLDQFKKDPTQLIADYKNYAMSDETGLKYTYDNAKGPDPIRRGGGGGNDFFDGFYGGRGASNSWESAGAKSAMRQNIDNRKTFGDYDGVFGDYVYNKNNDTYTNKVDGVTMSPWEVIKKEKLTRQGETSTSFTTAASIKGKKAKEDIINKFSGDLGTAFIDMDEDDAEVYLRKNLPSDYTFEPYGIGDAIEIKAPNGDIVKIDLEPFTDKGDLDEKNKVIKFLQATYDPNNYDDDGQPILK